MTVRPILRVLGILALVAGLALGAVGWYVSGEIIDGLRPTPFTPPPVAVESIDPDGVRLRVESDPDREADRDAVVGLQLDGGYAQLGPAAEATGPIQTRQVLGTWGDAPRPGTASFDTFAFPDPTAAGRQVETVTFPGPLGELDAWWFPGDGSTWIVAVHGLGAGPREFLRLAHALPSRPVLAITYRNDPGQPVTEDGLVLAGQRAWADVDAAVAHARELGATRVVIAGMSMGGALALGYLVEGDTRGVAGAVLEAPVADLREVIRLRSGEALPVGGAVGDGILAVGRAVTGLRTGLDFDRVDYVERSRELTVPILLFHGTEDVPVPLPVSEALAAARPDLVELVRIPDAAHVRAWNEDPDGYRETLEEFLSRLDSSS